MRTADRGKSAPWLGWRAAGRKTPAHATRQGERSNIRVCPDARARHARSACLGPERSLPAGGRRRAGFAPV